MSNRILSVICFVALAVFSSIAHAVQYGPYAIAVMRVIDGDTLDVRAEIWPGLDMEVNVRLADVDTPETHGANIPDCERAAGAAATAFTRDWLTAHAPLSLLYLKRDKYGRVLGRISGGGADLSRDLIQSGHARPYAGGRRAGWC